MKARDAFCLVAKDFGVLALAEKMGANADTLQNKANPRSASHRPTLEDCEAATLFTGDARIADVFCALAGGVFVKTGDFAGVSDQELLDEMAALAKEYADVAVAVSSALADGNVDQGDLDRVKAQIYELNQRAARVYARLAGMKRETKLRAVPK